MTTEAIIDSTDAGFRVIPASGLVVGSQVADVYGGSHAVARVTRRKDGSVRTVRDDGWVDVFLPGDVVTLAN